MQQGHNLQLGAGGDVHLPQIDIEDQDIDTLLAQKLVFSEVPSIQCRMPFMCTASMCKTAHVAQSYIELRCCLFVPDGSSNCTR